MGPNRAVTLVMAIALCLAGSWSDTANAQTLPRSPRDASRAVADDGRAAEQAVRSGRRSAALPVGPGPAARDWTARAMGGPAGAKDPRVDLAVAHNLVRLFSVESPYATSDLALARALADDGSLKSHGLPAALARYAEELGDVAALPAGRASLEAARLTTVGPIAVIRPGTGSVTLPAHATVVVVDLRNLPAVDELNDILPRMIAPAMKTAVEQPVRFVRTHNGPLDESFSFFNVYSTSVEQLQPPAFAGTGARDLPIVLLTGKHLAPQAAAFAAALRFARRAWILGDSVPLQVAESTWQGVGRQGLLVRTSMMATVSVLPPEVLVNQFVAQSPDFSRAYFRELTLDTPSILDIGTRDAHGADLDLFLFRELADGSFEFVAPPFVLDGPADENLHLATVRAGRYLIVVLGFNVPGGSTSFTLRIARSRIAPLPDIVPADLAGDLSEPAALTPWPFAASTPPPVVGPAIRSLPEVVNPFGTLLPVQDGRGDLRAGLIAAHGMVRRFFRYFPVVGDTIDVRLLETLEAADAHDGVDRVAAWRILRRFGEALHDGHQFVFTFDRLFQTKLPVFLEHIDGRPVVRRSGAAEIRAGDTIVALEHRRIEEVYAEELARTSAATLGYQLDLADRVIYNMNGPLTLTLANPQGEHRTVSVAPQPISVYDDVRARGESDRPNGPLTDLGAPQLFYLNLDNFTTRSGSDLRNALAAAARQGATGLVLDMRGFPADGFETARRLIATPFVSPIFRRNVYAGPFEPTVSTEQDQFSPLGPPAFHGPIVLLTGPHAVSGAENFMQMLIGAGRVKAVVGRRSAGTNGNITSLALPGGMFFLYTGMEVRNVDGSRFHGVGIVPNVEVPLTVADLRDGIDRALLTAIDLLR